MTEISNHRYPGKWGDNKEKVRYVSDMFNFYQCNKVIIQCHLDCDNRNK